MNTNVGQITLIDLISMLERRELIINKDYQRGSGIWPPFAKSYFIDTILESYPFPKIYLYQVFDRTNERPIKEIVDGQQRVTTLLEFYKNKFPLTSASKKYSGLRFNELPDEAKMNFISYQIETSTIYSASRAELLEMFRRMNAYTSPLTSAEKRHATFQGAFKWFIVEKADTHAELLEVYDILSPKILARMGDADFISEMAILIDRGICAKSAPTTEAIYKKYDTDFPLEDIFNEKIDYFFGLLANELSELRGTFMMKSYVVQSLFSAIVALKYGFPGSDVLEQELNFRADPNFSIDTARVIPILVEMADAHEIQDEDGPYAVYVTNCLSSTTKLPQRLSRAKELIKAFL
ncbi:DUF262 domain-containing protein [Klebsiella quasipneumoniae]|uniref:DUF262 domain-containing protein n=1 Tax=Klebsiella pneumoniae complex TaxID=3390273 RepID=UPI000B9C71DD|nr:MULTISPECIES: DUF262 domain-containing protein [Klebsiella]MBC4303274.1 DUF262 domain-containing protein [Klebsiella pneumoniae]MBK2541241.1 DUF262 domain-containing protein [Klebsiella quasipneumoniae]MBK2623266.1 DUF262 domain-containing protein [Klebsiella quasipneumoniae]MBK3025290.1 DUF262 domain-containing protein [Klebsiella quasipneumoniae]MCC4917564.1 DUF262 domain-containing protein [Klebsiella pneumoniae]